jgi:hypothetical protein
LVRLRELTLDIRKPRMCSHLDIVFLAISDSLLHNQGITGMKATCNVCMVDKRQQFQIRATDIIAIL